MLNRIQSIVYPTAYKSNANMLICGKSVHSIAFAFMADHHFR